MFDVGISELGIIGLVALIVIGPEQLPRVARTAGHLMGRLRRYVSDVKSDISREMEAADLQRTVDEIKDSALSFEHSMREQVAEIDASVHNSIASPELHQLLDQPVVEAHGSAETRQGPAEFESVTPTPEVAEVEAPADPNQIDMFGMPTQKPSASSGKS